MKKLTFKPFAALALTVSLIACQKNELIKTSGKEFDLDLFEENIKKALADKTIGFSYSISQNGVQKRKGADGAAVASWDSRSGAEIAHAPVKRQDLASCSKTYTALTVMRLLQEKKLTHKELLIDYLPSFWKKPAWSFNEITLGMLMNHTSGLIDGWLDYSALKQKTEGGGIFLHGGYKYVNANYAFLRVAIAYLSHESDLKKLENTYLKNPSNASEKALETAINDYYIEQVNQKVFAKCGIPYTYPKPDGEMNPTMNYNFNTKDPGWNKGDMTLHAGSAGWRLSSEEQNKILAHLKYTTNILNETWKKRMNDSLYGWSGTQKLAGGTAYYHGGYFEDKYGPNDAPTPKGRGCYTVHIVFGNNVEAAVQSNSLGGLSTNMEGIVIPAFNNAWVEK